MPIQIGHKGDHGFEQPLGMLSDCHRRIERFLRAMLVVSRDEAGRPLSASGRAALQQASTYFRTAAPHHTADEEEDLFPLLRACSGDEDSELVATINALESEHRGAEAAHARIDALVRPWLELERDGLPEEDARELIARLESLERTYADHIRIEDEELFPAAGRLLAAHHLEELGRAMAERRGLSYRGPLARFLGADHERLHELLAASLAGTDGVRMAPFAGFRAGILRHISMEEKHLIPRATVARNGQRPAVADLLHIDHGAIAALLVPPPTRDIVTELRSILERHDRCEEEPGGLYDTCDRALGAKASLHLVAELAQHAPVSLKPYNSSARVALHLRRSVDRSWDAWKRWSRTNPPTRGMRMATEMATERALHGQVVDLDSFPSKGAGASSRALVKTPDFEVLCIHLPAGTSLPAHEVEGPITVHCLQGELALTVDGEPRKMSAGAWVFLDRGTAHAVEAMKDSSLLVTILFVKESMEAER